MNYEFFIAKRYLMSKKRTGFISFSTLFSFIVIVLGVACITIIMSIMNGFESVVVDRFLALDSHVRIIGKGVDDLEEPDKIADILDSIPETAAYSPFILEKVMLISERETMVVSLKGIDLNTVDGVSKFHDVIVYGTGDFTSMDNPGQPRPGIILGEGVADRIGALRGDEIRIMSTRGVGGYFREPDVATFEVTGFFKTDISEYDYLYAFMSLPDAQRFFRMRGAVTGFDVNAADIEKTAELAGAIETALPDGMLVRTWYDLHKNLYSSMKLEKIAALLVLSLIILVASFSISSSLIMLVLEKRREIGIIKSVGSNEHGIKRIFVCNGMIISVFGTILGLVTGFVLSWIQLRYELILLPHDVYIISALPVEIRAIDYIMVGLIAMILTYCATLYPARKAAGMKPAQALRYE